jgi:hypothetical protein
VSTYLFTYRKYISTYYDSSALNNLLSLLHLVHQVKLDLVLSLLKPTIGHTHIPHTRCRSISLIVLFTTLKYRFPSLVTGKITRQSIRRAVQMGITVDQIISYLSTHAHLQIRKHTAFSPPPNCG